MHLIALRPIPHTFINFLQHNTLNRPGTLIPPTASKVETTGTVRKSYKPKYNEKFVFRTKQSANDMIMMKIMEHSPSGGAPSIFGSVILSCLPSNASWINFLAYNGPMIPGYKNYLANLTLAHA